MAPYELRSLAAAHISYGDKDKDGKKPVIISNETLTLSPTHAAQLDDLAGKLGMKVEVEKLSNRGAVLVKAKDLVAVLSAAAEKSVELNDPE